MCRKNTIISRKKCRNVCRFENDSYLCSALREKHYWKVVLERWQSGRLRRSWKPLYCEVPGVRIPVSPQQTLKISRLQTNTQFYTQECKVGVFVLFKIIQPLHNKRVAILKESDEKRLIFIYPFSLIFQDFTSSWKYLLLYSNVRSGL